MSVESLFFTVEEVATLLHVSRRTVERRLREKASKPGELTRVKLDPTKPHSAVRIPRAEVDALIDALMPRKRRTRAA